MTAPWKKLLPFGVLVLGIVVTGALFFLKPAVSRARPAAPKPTVRVLTVNARDVQAVVRSTGTVVPSQSVTLLSQATGRVVSQAKALIPGGRFRSGDIMVRLDSRDYELAMAEKESQLRQAEVELQLEEGRQEVAKAEWELLGAKEGVPEAALALRKPQLAAAVENYRAAQSGLERAKLDLSRTVLRAPFNALVVEENVDIGQMVSPSAVVAGLIGTDRFWIEGSISVEQLGLIEVPNFNATQGSLADVVHELGVGESVTREGRVIGLAGGLDVLTRTAKLLIAVDHPLDPPEGAAPLLNGAFVHVAIQGRSMADVFIVPRVSVIEGAAVWVVDEGGRLSRREITIGWGDGETVAVTRGLSEGDRVVITTLAHPINGMEVLVADTATEPAVGS